MGGTNWSAKEYDDRTKHRAAMKTPTFAYTAAIDSGSVAAATHASLDPRGVKVRESRDSDVHPEAVPIAVLFDVTGSMGSVPRTLQAKMKDLMSLLIRKGYCDHPAIMIGGIGDAKCDGSPLQVGQFESGIEIEDNLTNLYLEGGGGGQKRESYELALYFMARHTAHDHLDKRGSKGYLFIIGDEMPYTHIHPGEVKRFVDAELAEPLTIEAILEELRESYEVFFVLPNLTTYFNDTEVQRTWKELLPERVILLDDPEAICETIAAQVGMCEGKVGSDVVADLVDAGVKRGIAQSVSRSLVPVAAPSGRGTVQKVPTSGATGGLAKF